MKFNPCTGQCSEDGALCEGCGRSHEEIEQLHRLVNGLVEFARKMDYQNIDEFAEGVAGSLRYAMGAGRPK